MNKETAASALNLVSLRLGYSHPKPAQVEAVTTFILGSCPSTVGFDMIKQKIAFSVIIVLDIGGDNIMDYRYAL